MQDKANFLLHFRVAAGEVLSPEEEEKVLRKMIKDRDLKLKGKTPKSNKASKKSQEASSNQSKSATPASAALNT